MCILLHRALPPVKVRFMSRHGYGTEWVLGSSIIMNALHLLLIIGDIQFLSTNLFSNVQYILGYYNPLQLTFVYIQLLYLFLDCHSFKFPR